MPGPVSDTYDPEFGTSGNAREVAESMKEVADKITVLLGPQLKNIVEVACSEPDMARILVLTERELRLIRFGLNRAIDSI